MRNISIEDRVMNNTKVIVRDINRKFVTVETLLEHMQASSPPSDRISLHVDPEWSDCGTEAIPTPAVLCDHSQQGSGPDTEKGVP